MSAVGGGCPARKNGHPPPTAAEQDDPTEEQGEKEKVYLLDGKLYRITAQHKHHDTQTAIIDLVMCTKSKEL